MSNAWSANGSAQASPWTYGDLGIAPPEARAVVQPERGDPRRPRIELLEEVVGRRTRRAHRRRRSRSRPRRRRGPSSRASGASRRGRAGASCGGSGARRRRRASSGRRYRAGAALRPGRGSVSRAWSRTSSHRAGPTGSRLMCRGGTWRGALPGRLARRSRGSDATGASSCGRRGERGPRTRPVHARARRRHVRVPRRFARDPLLGPTVRALAGYRPLRLATVAHAALRAMCGQLIESGRAAAIERSVLRRARCRGRDP